MKLPEDFIGRVSEIFDSKEMSEPLISVYQNIEFMVCIECNSMIISHDTTRYFFNGSEKWVFPTVFGGDYLDDCIRRVFERDSLIQELFDCDFNNKNMKITVRDKENVSGVD